MFQSAHRLESEVLERMLMLAYAKNHFMVVTALGPERPGLLLVWNLWNCLAWVIVVRGGLCPWAEL